MLPSHCQTYSASEIQNVVAAIWSKVLRVEDIGIDDNFFDLAGDSISAVKIISLIHDQLGVEVQPIHIFNHPTINELTLVIKANQAR